MGCNCGKKKHNPTANSSPPPSMAVSSSKEKSMNDTDFVKVKYVHPNRGQHRVVGAITGTFYGYRGGGSVFLINRQDLAAQPHYFVEISESPKPPLQPVKPTPAPEPVAVKEEAPPPVVVPVQETIIGEARLDLQTLPGVTPRIARNLSEAGLNTVEAILKAKVKGLTRVKFVGEGKATVIYNHVKRMNE